MPSEDFRRALGKDADGASGMTAWLPSPTLKDHWFGDAEQFAKAWKAKFGYDPDYHAAAGVAAVEALVNAIQSAGSLDAGKVRDALAKTNFESLYGKIAFNDKGQINLPQIMIQIQNDKVVPIFAGKEFINKLEYPLPPWDKRQ